MKYFLRTHPLLVLLSMPSSSKESPSPPCTCLVFIATSQDGYITDKDNKVDWLNNLQQSHPLPEGDDGGFLSFMDGADAIIMDRITYETVLGFVESGVAPRWPDGNTPLYVFTRTPNAIQLPSKDLVVGEAIV